MMIAVIMAMFFARWVGSYSCDRNCEWLEFMVRTALPPDYCDTHEGDVCEEEDYCETHVDVEACETLCLSHARAR